MAPQSIHKDILDVLIEVRNEIRSASPPHLEDAARVARALNRVLILCSSCVCCSSWARSGSVQHGDIRCCHFHDDVKMGKQSLEAGWLLVVLTVGWSYEHFRRRSIFVY